ncbi:uncharacterized protein LOC133314140 [Gastrolobium bilobum]|uniref:uncharacterized protein LOC133314140 n=1 Tax=Gastrolobium bilobum TaxID=150636 RepID=UPI002AB04923|nr:uncharacterized protein LOC133314140 [Gastrolobium bilobum]
MCQMSGARRLTPCSPRGIVFNAIPMAILPMGHGHIGTIPNRHGRGQMVASSNRLLHQMDRGRGFSHDISQKFNQILQDLHVKHRYTSVELPQTNGLAEAANRVLKRGLERRLEAAKGDWSEQLDFVLWGYRTTKHSTTGETPFRMVCGSEAMIPVEIGEPSWRRMYTNEDSNSQALLHNLDAIEEARKVAHVKEIALKQRIETCYNSKVVRRSFNVGDLVLRRADIGNKNAWQGKLAANWEGIYRIYSKTDKGA